MTTSVSTNLEQRALAETKRHMLTYAELQLQKQDDVRGIVRSLVDRHPPSWRLATTVIVMSLMNAARGSPDLGHTGLWGLMDEYGPHGALLIALIYMVFLLTTQRTSRRLSCLLAELEASEASA